MEDLEGRWHGEEDEEEDSGALGAVLAIAAGVAATYFLTSDRAAPARTRVRETAETVRREATNRWERYQQQRHERSNGQPGDGRNPVGAIPLRRDPSGRLRATQLRMSLHKRPVAPDGRLIGGRCARTDLLGP